MIERGEQERGRQQAFCWEVEQAQSAQSAACSVYSSLGQACVFGCVLVWGGLSPLCQPVSVPLHKPQRTDRMSYDPDALVRTAALKYLTWAGPSFTFSLPRSLSICHPVTHNVTHLIAPLSFPAPLFAPQLHPLLAALSACRGSHEFICCSTVFLLRRD